MPGKLVSLFYILLLCATASKGQLMQVTHFSGAATYGSRTVTVTTTGSTSTITDPCLGPPLQYHAGPSGAGTYSYTLSGPVYSVRIEAHGLNAGPLAGGEYLSMNVNGAPYSLTAADMVSYSNCGSAGAGPSYLSGGRLYGPLGVFSWSHHNAGIIQLNSCEGISSFSIFCDGIGAGVAYHVYVDTTAPAGCALTASNNGPLCVSDTLKLFATGGAGGTYAWTGPAGFSSTDQNPVIPNATAANAGTYTVVYSSGAATLTATTVVTVHSPPVLVTSSSSPVCEGDTLLLYVTPTIAGMTYSWTGPDGFTSALQNPMVTGVTASAAGTYTVTAHLSGCHDTAYADVAISPGLSLAAANNGPLCAGQTLTLAVLPTIPGGTYSWKGPGGYTSGLSTPLISPAAVVHSGTYSVTVSFNGCDNTTSTVVVVHPIPSITAVATSPACEGQPLYLFANASDGTYTYSWAGPDGFTSILKDPGITSAAVTGSGIYTVIASIGSCHDTAFVQVTVKPTPEVTASCNAPLCAGADLKLLAGPAGADRVFSWSGPLGFTSTQPNPVIKAVKAGASGKYVVTVNQDGCERAAIVTVNVVAMEQELRDTTLCRGENHPLLFTAVVPDGATVEWNTGATTAQIVLQDTGKYWVTVTAPGCTVTDTVKIIGRSCNCNLALPSAFTPNGDGRNDVFRPVIPFGCTVIQYELFIFDRWGNRVFATGDPSTGWDGVFNGNRQDMGVYMYFMRYKGDADNLEHMLKGDVTLVR